MTMSKYYISYLGSEESEDTFYFKDEEAQEKLDSIPAEIENVQNQVTENTTNINTAQQQITEIIAEGGEPNVIEEIQVNGATLAIEDKTVNVPVPTNVSELDNDSGYITEADVPTKLSELSDDVGYAKESEIPTKTSELENDSDFTTGSEVRSEIAAQIAEIVAGAPEDLDTLKEIADWIEGHAEDAAAMNSEIKDNTKSIEELQDAVEDIDVPDFGYISDSETIYKSSQDSDFWYLEGQKSIVFDSDTSLAYDSSSSAITFDDSDDFTYNESSTSFEFYALASSAGNDGYVSNLVDLDTGENHMIKDSEARDYIENLEESVETISSEVTDLQEQTANLKTEISDVRTEIAEDIPTKTSELENDSGFITSADVPTKTSELENDSDYATTAQVTAATKESVIEVTLSASGWSSAYPYTQTVSVSSMTSDSLFYVGILYPLDCDRDTQEDINEAASYLFDIESGDGTVIFKATEEPEVDIPLGLRGVF